MLTSPKKLESQSTPPQADRKTPEELKDVLKKFQPSYLNDEDFSEIANSIPYYFDESDGFTYQQVLKLAQNRDYLTQYQLVFKKYIDHLQIHDDGQNLHAKILNFNPSQLTTFLKFVQSIQLLAIVNKLNSSRLSSSIDINIFNQLFLLLRSDKIPTQQCSEISLDQTSKISEEQLKMILRGGFLIDKRRIVFDNPSLAQEMKFYWLSFVGNNGDQSVREHLKKNKHYFTHSLNLNIYKNKPLQPSDPNDPETLPPPPKSDWEQEVNSGIGQNGSPFENHARVDSLSLPNQENKGRLQVSGEGFGGRLITNKANTGSRLEAIAEKPEDTIGSDSPDVLRVSDKGDGADQPSINSKPISKPSPIEIQSDTQAQSYQIINQPASQLITLSQSAKKQINVQDFWYQNPRENNYRIMSCQAHETLKKVQEETEKNMVISLEKAKDILNLSDSDVKIAIMLAKRFGGLSALSCDKITKNQEINQHFTKAFGDWKQNSSSQNAPNPQELTIDNYLIKLKTFSAKFQQFNKIKNILTGRESPKKHVGLRLTFVSQAVINKFESIDRN